MVLYKYNILKIKKPRYIFQKCKQYINLLLSIISQSLILNIEDLGPLVLVGCSHPGLDNILKRVCEVTGSQKVYGVLGGYHIDISKVERVCKIFEKYGVKLAGPCHCTSDDAINEFKNRLGPKFVEIYTGKILEFP